MLGAHFRLTTTKSPDLCSLLLSEVLINIIMFSNVNLYQSSYISSVRLKGSVTQNLMWTYAWDIRKELNLAVKLCFYITERLKNWIILSSKISSWFLSENYKYVAKWKIWISVFCLNLWLIWKSSRFFYCLRLQGFGF